MMDRLAKYGADLGLGAPTGLGLNSEEGGFLPTEEWYREQKRKNPKAEGSRSATRSTPSSARARRA